MKPLRQALAGLFAAGTVFAAIMVVLVVTSDHQDDRVLMAVLGPVIGLSFIGTGIFAWLRRPHNRFGAIMAAVGFAWFLTGLMSADDGVAYTLGCYLAPLYLVLVGHMLLAFPNGVLEGRAPRALLAVAYVDVLLVPIPFLLLGGRLEGANGAPENALSITDAPDTAKPFQTVAVAVGCALVAWILVLLWRRRRRATEPQRRAMAFVLWAGLAFLVVLGASFVQDLSTSEDDHGSVASDLLLFMFAALPYAFLVGLLRTRWTRAGAVGELVERLGEEHAGRASLRVALADALGDSSLTLAYWSRAGERYVDAEGRPATLPAPDATDRVVTEIERDGRPVAAIVHDAALLDEPGLVRAAGAAAALSLENERLEAELRARVAELQASRAKLIEVGMAERRALERNLHDGAQQRLVALSLQLGLARARLRDDPAVAEGILEAAREELAAALEELRELARGIHPAILTERGLGPAIAALAGRAPLEVEVGALPEDRLPAPVEAAAYFVVAESLTNVAKYAGAARATVRVLKENGYAVVEIQDDGVGGADPGGGSGLRGLVDRVQALDGRLDVHSPPGAGTVVRATLPCA